MRIYCFGDIHGNVDALDACFEHLQNQKADAVYCLGDLAGWLPFGAATLARVRSAGIPTVAGNHDLLIAGSIVDHPNQIDRMQATAYNAGLLSTVDGAIDYLRALPLIIEGENFTAVHHSPFDLPRDDSSLTIRSFDYLDEASLQRSIPEWQKHPAKLIFSGHDHIPAVYELSGAGKVTAHRPGARESLSLSLEKGSRYWVKTGSVGGPYRDGVAMANSVLYDSKSETLTLFRIPYGTRALRDALSSHRFFMNINTIRKYVDLL